MRAALPPGTTAAVRGEGQRRTRPWSRARRPRPTGSRSPPAASCGWPGRPGPGGSPSAARPRPTPSWRAARGRAGADVTVNVRERATSSAGSPRSAAGADRPVRVGAAGQPGRRPALHRQPPDDRRRRPRSASTRPTARRAGAGRPRPALGVVGFHLHAVSNNLDAAAHAAFVRDAWTGRPPPPPGSASTCGRSTSAAASASTTPAAPLRPGHAARRPARRRPPASTWSSSRAGSWPRRRLVRRRGARPQAHPRPLVRGAARRHPPLPAARRLGVQPPVHGAAGRRVAVPVRPARRSRDARGRRGRRAVHPARRAHPRPAGRTGCGSATCWSSPTPARTAGTSRTTTSCGTRTRR